MKLTNLKNYVNEHMDVPVGIFQNDDMGEAQECFFALVSDYVGMKGELSAEDLEYLAELDEDYYEWLAELIPHYELHVLGAPYGEVEESYDFFNWEQGKEAFDNLNEDGVYLDLISVTPDGVDDGAGEHLTNY